MEAIMDITIEELISCADLRMGFPIMKDIRPNISENRYVNLIKHMQLEGYRIFSAWHNKQIIGLIGFSILTNLYYGRHIWINDLVVTKPYQSKGVGKQLMHYVEDIAKQEHCHIIALSSGLERTHAHHFYTQTMDYTQPSLVFKKELG